MSLSTRIMRELEDLDGVLERVIKSIDRGDANMTDIRRAIDNARRDEMRELDRLLRQAKRELQKTRSG